MEKNNGRAQRIVVIGPESTGKTTLSSFLAKYYDTEWVPEYARYYLNNLERPYQKSDLLEIAKGQLDWEDDQHNKARELLICDTDLIVIKVWSEHKYGSCDKEILKAIEERHYDLYLLTDIDFPWEDDPLRENPTLREYFMGVFKEEIEKTKTPYEIIDGDFNQREKKAIEAIDRLLTGR